MSFHPDLDAVFFVFGLLFMIFLAVFIRNSTTETLSQQQKNDSEAITLGDVISTPKGPEIQISKDNDPDGKDKVVKQKSVSDNEFYYVSASLPEKEKAANLLAEVYRREQFLLQSVDEMLENGGTVFASDKTNITENMKLLVKKHFKKKIPFAEYFNPRDLTVGTNSAKGELVEICLRDKYNTNQWNSINTIFRVHVHELAHSADTEYRNDGNHGEVFNRLMNFLLETSENLGIYSCDEYKKSGRKFCGLVLQEADTFCR